MTSFLTALTSTASRCDFHVKRASRVTPRNVGVLTRGTGWLFKFSETFSFAVDSAKSVLIVLVMLSCSAKFSVQLHTSLIVSGCGGAKSSSCKVFNKYLGIVVVVSNILNQK